MNTSYRLTGTLWDSRYESSILQAETYLLTCMRYIELNPVRATMVEDPAHYRWTSYRANAVGQMSFQQYWELPNQRRQRITLGV